MRPLTFLSLLLLCNLYGLAFDTVVVARTGGIFCDLLGKQACSLSPLEDYRLSAATLLLLLPAACIMLANWFSSGYRLLKSSTFLGLLLITP